MLVSRGHLETCAFFLTNRYKMAKNCQHLVWHQIRAAISYYKLGQALLEIRTGQLLQIGAVLQFRIKRLKKIRAGITNQECLPRCDTS